MKLTPFLLATSIAPLAMASVLPPPGHVHSDKMAKHGLSKHEIALVEPRGLADDIRTKKKCDSMFKSDKTPYRDACASQPDDDSANLCMLRALVGDASIECRAALMETMGF
jgi:hypothetical protein